jgi:hypothetical protein
MADIKSVVFSHVEIAELLVKKQDIHEGYWGLYLEFSLAGANVPMPPDNTTFLPAAIAFVNKIGIQKFDAPSNLTVDAAVVNPKGKAK